MLKTLAFGCLLWQLKASNSVATPISALLTCTAGFHTETEGEDEEGEAGQGEGEVAD